MGLAWQRVFFPPLQISSLLFLCFYFPLFFLSPPFWRATAFVSMSNIISGKKGEAGKKKKERKRGRRRGRGEKYSWGRGREARDRKSALRERGFPEKKERRRKKCRNILGRGKEKEETAFVGNSLPRSLPTLSPSPIYFLFFPPSSSFCALTHFQRNKFVSRSRRRHNIEWLVSRIDSLIGSKGRREKQHWQSGRKRSETNFPQKTHASIWTKKIQLYFLLPMSQFLHFCDTIPFRSLDMCDCECMYCMLVISPTTVSSFHGLGLAAARPHNIFYYFLFFFFRQIAGCDRRTMET